MTMRHRRCDGMLCYGTDTIVSYSAVNLVRDYAIPEIRYMMTCITFPCMYIGLGILMYCPDGTFRAAAE